MSSFFEQNVAWLTPGEMPGHQHYFGGPAIHHGSVPKRREHSIHLLYDLDLCDPALGLASCFPKLSRLPLYNALQFNCCDIVYDVRSDDEIEILDMPDKNTQWDRNFPFDNYPAAFLRCPIRTTAATQAERHLLDTFIEDDGGSPRNGRDHIMEPTMLRPIVGGRHLLWQDVPHWQCPIDGCRWHGRYGKHGKEVFAVIWERPVPDINLWSDDPKDTFMGSAQIIFSRCVGCGVIHSCNRCD